MITDLLVSAVIAGATALLSLMPSFTLPWTAQDDQHGPLELHYLATVNEVVPLSSLVAAFLLLLTVSFAFFAWDAAVWLFHQFWGSD